MESDGVLIAQAQTNQTIFTNQTPSNPNASDGGTSYELGMKFISAKSGQITAIRYWKAPSENGSHTGKIWASTGSSPLVSVTFANETASGWQEQALSTPLNIQANTTYVVSVNSNSYFPITYTELANSIVNGDLSSVADGNNGVFGSPNSLPTNSYQNSNYYRDIVFVAVGTATITKVSGDNQTHTGGTALPNPLVVLVKDASGNPQSGVTVNFAVTAGGGSVSPTSAVTDANGQASTVLTLGATPPGATSPVTNTVSATASGIGSVTFSATANPPGGTTNNQTIFTTQTPSNPNASDGGTSYELGMKFRSAKAGQITAIRYWKATSETGTHVGKIWTATGSALVSVTFANETASGWQQQALSSPLNIEANTTYVVSVNSNSYFTVAYDQLATSIVNGDLSTVADGNNGVYGDPNNFPIGSYRNSNYFRDIVFLAASNIIKVSGDNQMGTVGTPLPDPLVVQVLDTAGNPQSGVTVNFAVTAGGGSVSPTSAVTGANGQSSTVLTLGPIPSGPNDAVIITATAVGIGNVTFSAKANGPTSSNPIVLENQKPGNVGWRIANGAVGQIAGYAGAVSVNKGDSLPIKVSLAQPGNFKIDVYRLGYYGGYGGRFIISSGWINGITQPACTMTDSNTRLFECNWSTSYTIAVGNDWTTGLYIAKLTEQATSLESQVWFVVRDDSSSSDILFQSSFTNLLAYSSGAGGYSLYGFSSIGGQRAFKVSLDQPFSQTTTAPGEFNNLLRWEPYMVRWLESQGYDVSYVTNLDVHANPQLLQQHKVFLSVGHDEYWSLEERNNVENARNAGVNLAFFSANTCYWRVRFENGSNGGTNRVMACYKEDWAQDPVAPTNKFRSPQNNRPENALLGVMYTGDRDNLYGGYDFVVSNNTDPYYAHTNLNNGDTLSLLVGFEWDAVVNNGASPPGLVVLSQSSVNPGNIDTDLPVGTNTQISNAVCYTAPSGAKVFAIGSIQWVWGLDNGDMYRQDLRAKQIAVNILADMNARPQTPDANIIVP
jgi:Domain of unknown function (DUF4082)/Bacterial Ig-like domain (group 1)